MSVTNAPLITANHHNQWFYRNDNSRYCVILMMSIHT